MPQIGQQKKEACDTLPDLDTLAWGRCVTLTAEGRLTEEAVAAAVGVSLLTLRTWRASAEFQERTALAIDEYRTRSLERYGLPSFVRIACVLPPRRHGWPF
jgi:hypothetical protein